MAAGNSTVGFFDNPSIGRKIASIASIGAVGWSGFVAVGAIDRVGIRPRQSETPRP